MSAPYPPGGPYRKGEKVAALRMLTVRPCVDCLWMGAPAYSDRCTEPDLGCIYSERSVVTDKVQVAHTPCSIVRSNHDEPEGCPGFTARPKGGFGRWWDEWFGTLLFKGRARRKLGSIE